MATRRIVERGYHAAAGGPEYVKLTCGHLVEHDDTRHGIGMRVCPDCSGLRALAKLQGKGDTMAKKPADRPPKDEQKPTRGKPAWTKNKTIEK